jgi:hypothetical protein
MKTRDQIRLIDELKIKQLGQLLSLQHSQKTELQTYCEKNGGHVFTGVISRRIVRNELGEIIGSREVEYCDVCLYEDWKEVKLL